MWSAGTAFWKLLLKQFDDLLVKILIGSAIVSFLLALVDGEHGAHAFLEPAVILLILAANAAVGVITETNAGKAIEELKAYAADVATVVRSGEWAHVKPHPSTAPPWALSLEAVVCRPPLHPACQGGGAGGRGGSDG